MMTKVYTLQQYWWLVTLPHGILRQSPMGQLEHINDHISLLQMLQILLMLLIVEL